MGHDNLDTEADGYDAERGAGDLPFPWRRLTVFSALNAGGLHYILGLSVEDLTMTKLVLLVALAFTISTGSITMLVFNPQPAMACPGGH